MAGPCCVRTPVRVPLWEMEPGRWVQPQLGGRALERRSGSDVILKLVSFSLLTALSECPLGRVSHLWSVLPSSLAAFLATSRLCT